MIDSPKKIIIISDGTGKTAKRLMDAVLSQYRRAKVNYELVHTYPEIRDEKAVDRVMQNIDDGYLVLYSIISRNLSKYFHAALTEQGILHVNVLEPMLKTMRKFLGVHPDYRPGILHRIDDRYYKKVDAIGFTVEHDDGRGPLIEEADLVLLGLSRTCKTPISMYLACNFGMKVANIPIVPGVTSEQMLEQRLKRIGNDRVIGLLMDPDVLARVREERLEYLARADDAVVELNDYHDVRVIRKEFRFCRELFEKHNIKMINVTRRAIEEVSLEILDELGLCPED